MSRRIPLAWALFAALIAWVCIAASPAAAKQRTVWLCKPGLADNPCVSDLDTTRLSPSGEILGVERIDAEPANVDCFYVYPTVSDDPGSNSDLSIDPEMRSIALDQAARYSEHCRLFAPVYRQVTITQVLLHGIETITAEMRAIAYEDVRRAWRRYLRRHNGGRGVVLIGHSQGTQMLRRLIREEIDRRPRSRKRLVSAILLGGNVIVKEGRTFGGEFRHLRGCRSVKDVRCVVGFSTFDEPVPANALFGRATPNPLFGHDEGEVPGDPARFDVLCTNPASLRGGPGDLDMVRSTVPFAPGTTLGLGTSLIGYPSPSSAVSTPWIEFEDAYTGECLPVDDANVLQVTPATGASDLNALPSSAWGLHLAEATITLGTLVSLVGDQIDSHLKRGHRGPRASTRGRPIEVVGNQ